MTVDVKLTLSRKNNNADCVTSEKTEITPLIDAHKPLGLLPIGQPIPTV